MTNSKGMRRGTRHKFSKAFRCHGPVHLSTYMHTYKMGELVTIKIDPSIHKGMPYKFYHGRTGRVFSVFPRALGVKLYKTRKGKVEEKLIYVRIEHLFRCRTPELFKQRVKENDRLRKLSKETGIKYQLKRLPEGPRPAHVVKIVEPPTLLRPIPYEFMA